MGTPVWLTVGIVLLLLGFFVRSGIFQWIIDAIGLILIIIGIIVIIIALVNMITGRKRESGGF